MKGVARRYLAGQVQGINHFRVFLIGVAVEASSANLNTERSYNEKVTGSDLLLELDLPGIC